MQERSHIKVDPGKARQLFRKLGDNLQKDIDDGLYDHPEAWRIGWLLNEPKTLADIAENIFERFRSAGAEFTLNLEDVDHESIMQAESFRKEIHEDTV